MYITESQTVVIFLAELLGWLYYTFLDGRVNLIIGMSLKEKGSETARENTCSISLHMGNREVKHPDTTMHVKRIVKSKEGQ